MTNSHTGRLSGYRITETLYEGSHTQVYRAVTAAKAPRESQTVAIKALRSEYPTFDELLHFRNQYSICHRLDHPGLLRMVELADYGNGQAIVMENFCGISLSKYLSQRLEEKQRLSPIEVLSIGVQLAEILHYLGEQRVIHKDIKPANILIHPQSKQIKLIDFSIASLLPRETQALKSPNGLEGTLAYLAPEQTGRMNRGIDYRADFYTLGVTLFELSTGSLPFQANEPMEWVHCHMAKQPPLINDLVPMPVEIAAIVHKLMAKSAENRYQSALGLKYDLETCLYQLKDTGSIEPFEMGQRDVSDRFLIPEKLYGRSAEIEALLTAFERAAVGNAEMMLVAGFSGIGKTAVIKEVYKPITRQQGYFIKSKFDQLNRDIPLSAFVQTLRDLMGQLLSETDSAIAQWRSKILDAVGENGQLLIEVIPELEHIIGQQPAVPELSGTAAENRFNRLLQNFIGVFTAPQHPLTIFLDDLQWADSASLQLTQQLAQETKHLLLLGAYRDNEISPGHGLPLMIDTLEKANVTVNTITLAPLTLDDTNQLVADALQGSKAVAKPLTELLLRKTKGNPFFTVQFLKSLHEAGHITFDPTQGHWQCDIAQVSTLALTDDVVALMAQQLQKLSETTQHILQLAACVGNRFDLSTLTTVLEQSPSAIAKALWEALQAGLIVPTNQTYKLFQTDDEQQISTEEQSSTKAVINSTYRFLHDRVQQAAYAGIPDDEKQMTHLKIGRLLLQNTPAQSREENLFNIVSQLNMGRLLLEDAEQTELALLNLEAAKKAKAAIAYTASEGYLKTAIQLLNAEGSASQGTNNNNNNDDLRLQIHNLLAEVSYLSGHYDLSAQQIDYVFSHTETVLERVDAYNIRIQLLIAQAQFDAALDSGLEALALLGVPLQEEPPQTVDFDRLYHLPTATDTSAIAALTVLGQLFAPIIIARPELIPKLAFTMLNLTLTYGNSPQGAFGYALYGMLLCGSATDIETGYRFGELAVHILAQYESVEFVCKINQIFIAFIHSWRKPVRKGIEKFVENVQIGLETGDLEFACYSAVNYCDSHCVIGTPLKKTRQKQTHYIEVVKRAQQEFSHSAALIWGQFTENLTETSAEPTQLVGTLFDEQTQLARLKETNAFSLLFFVYTAKTILHYLFGDYEGTLEQATLAMQQEAAAAGMFLTVQPPFYKALALLADNCERSCEQQAAQITEAIALQQRLKDWAVHAPENFQHKVDLIDAEMARLQNQRAQAIDLYDQAIAGAKQHGYLHEEAIANELAAKFYLAWGKARLAATYLQDAYYAYARWDAKAKTNDLEKRYPQLLQNIVQNNAENSAQNSLLKDTTASQTSTDVLFSMTAVKSSIHPAHASWSASSAVSLGSSSQTSHASTTSTNVALDFASVVKAAQSLSSTIELEELIGQLTQLILQNSGGDRCILSLPNQDGVWCVKAEATPETMQLSSSPVDSYANVPTKLLHYVKNTQAVVVIDQLKTDLPVIGHYLAQSQPQSVLSLPILNQSHLIGMLYLENQSNSHVFTRDRLFTLNFLCTQAAISLENARLYQQAQTYAQQLEESQLQTIQNEKMATLGNLVAGVAHEINNPIGFLNGSIKNANSYLQDLLDHITLYKKHYSEPVEEILENEEDIDLDFLSDDFPKLLNSMKGATERIKGISVSLRTFSRADTEHKVCANLNDGIDSTLLILKYRLKGDENRPAIEVVKDYDLLPEIDCFPGQLNQVFMNILANAIDALNEASQESTFAKIKENPNRITVRTKLVESQVKIEIADNGPGIPESVKARIFDHLYTTKGVGKGTGLGLAIARQIVEDKHGGILSVISEVAQGTTFVIVLPITT